jgi:cytochrome b involved in lipid metabolism
MKRKNECEENFDQKKYIRREDLIKHHTPEDRIWVAYKDSVYDVTNYLKRHPGGSNFIRIAAGGYLEPYFEYYKFH